MNIRLFPWSTLAKTFQNIILEIRSQIDVLPEGHQKKHNNNIAMEEVELTAAEQCLKEKVKEIEEKKDGLGPWRVENADIKSALENFASGLEWDESDDRKVSEVLDLFSDINGAMWEQEKKNNLWIELSSCSDPGKNDIPIFFGGKHAKKRAESIPEKIIELLLTSATKMYTVSRTPLDPEETISHTVAQNLDGDDGTGTFADVMNTAIQEEWKKHPEKCLTMFFTLGKHNGVDPFMYNIRTAQNFAGALLKSIKSEPSFEDPTGKGGKPFRVIVTGTDATKPNTSSDYNVQIEGKDVKVMSYKIWKYNFVYAMSKLCQFYIIADAIQEITQTPVPVDLKKTINRMKVFIENAKEDGAYKGDDDSEITMSELNSISEDWDRIEEALKQHLKVARGISICYTPLHAKPWIDASFKKCKDESAGSPKGFIIQQIMSRLKNAISIEYAARAHF